MAQRNKFLAWAGVGLLGTMLLGGCSSGGDKNDNQQQTTLKVMYYDERGFYQQYGMLYYATHPNVDFEVVSNQSVYQDQNSKEPILDRMKKFIEEQKPDIIMADNELFRQLAEEGKLLDLETTVKDKKFNAEGLLPGLLDYMRELGGGKVYGLAPSLYSQVIYYNKDLFNKHGVDLPKDKMSWDELLTLAKRFPTDGQGDDRVYGLSLGYNSDPYQLANKIATSQRLTMINTSDMKVTLDTPAWKKAFETAFEAMKSGAIYKQDPNGFMNGSYEDYLMSDPFIAGKAAMKFDANYMMDNIKQAQDYLKGKDKDKAIKNWDIVSMPVDPQFPDESADTGLSNLFAVSATSSNADAAVDFLTYITGDQFARATAKTMMNGLPVRPDAMQNKDGLNINAFYALKPVDNPMVSVYAKLPSDFWMQMDGILQPAVQSAYDGNKPLADALAEAQTKLQAALLEAQQKKNEPAASPAASGSASVSASESGASVSVTVAQ